ncbi:uncharacterized protein LOC106155514 [Lingula anatina]|uniref:Uncharacterized protein LOC106155514 n=1 Tax=Lingula anatina TaxID=7574 RepID=A0A1S3HK68_LINAN|nr:uncharacterized protein LOC106155514 [Lingula anatina]|eukprot:XP_013385851.1 uncharacterized protein LOC106155514 [Lingula anatina]
MGNSLFSECTLSNAYQNVTAETSCPSLGAGPLVTPLCTFNPLFLLFTASGFRCMCPPGAFPFTFPGSFVQSTEAVVSVCLPITGSTCTTNADCNLRVTDCLGFASTISAAPPNFMPGISSDIASLMTPVTGLICSFNDRFNVDITPIYYCNAGSCAEYNTSPPENTPLVNGTILFYQGLVRDALPSLFTFYPNVVPDPSSGNRLSYLNENVFAAIFRNLFPPDIQSP